MRRNGDGPNGYGLLVQYKIIADEINKNVHNRIGPAACQVAKRGFIDPTLEWLVEKVNDTQNNMSYSA